MKTAHNLVRTGKDILALSLAVVSLPTLTKAAEPPKLQEQASKTPFQEQYSFKEQYSLSLGELKVECLVIASNVLSFSTNSPTSVADVQPLHYQLSDLLSTAYSAMPDARSVHPSKTRTNAFKDLNLTQQIVSTAGALESKLDNVITVLKEGTQPTFKIKQPLPSPQTIATNISTTNLIEVFVANPEEQRQARLKKATNKAISTATRLLNLINNNREK
jgi:hypothetical protein